MKRRSLERTTIVAVEGFASGLPLMAITRLLQGWLAASGIPISLIGLLGLIELPYTLKVLWAPIIDFWTIPWPDRRRGWICLLQILIAGSLISFTLLDPSTKGKDLIFIGIAALVTAVLSASLDIVVDAYRTDLLPDQERGIGAASATLGYRFAMLTIGGGGFFIAGTYGWQKAFLFSSILMLCLTPITIVGPKLRALKKPLLNFKEAVIGPGKEFLHRTERKKAFQLLLLVLLYRWPDGLLSLMATPFLIESGFKPEIIGAIQGGWGIAATMIGTAFGGITFSKIGLNKALWIYGLIGALSNLAYWWLAQFGGGNEELLIAVTVENFCGGMMVSAFIALLMSLCNPSFSATQYALFSSIYALSRSLLSAPGGFIAESIGWSNFFALSIITAIPSFLLMAILTPWTEHLPRGAFKSKREPI